MNALTKLTAAALTAAAVVIPATAASASAAELRDAEGCNHNTCIQVKGNASGYRVFGFFGQYGGGYGHFHIWGPNLDYNGPDKQWTSGTGAGTPIQYGYGAGQVCVEFWQYVNGTYVSSGLPCEVVS